MDSFRGGLGGGDLLPYAGGLLDQPDELLHDLILWRALVSIARRLNDAGTS